MPRDDMDLQDYVQGYEQSLDSFTEILEPLLNTPIEEIAAKLDVIERARVQLSLTARLNIIVYLQTNAVDPKSHPVVEQLKRIERYSKLVENTINPPKPTLSLNRGAASRFIKHSLPADDDNKN
ncbi:6006_t:CDS:2 [Paraglomus brasilianum]|uniref:Exosome complex protein n=1 Tax=Paraglomus brasilianum TaxID=144538 RepID=A0A9N8VSN3_9GLOM|nr:6006_t:CDS:2 [Paraglomus brasilianum]